MRCIFVETDIPAEFADMKVVEYMLANEDIKAQPHLTHDKIAGELRKLGFVEGSPATLDNTVCIYVCVNL